jgi:predicted RNase H-like nuclease (RuvC/YqgF family)
MSKELKDLIDTIDSSNRAHSEITKMINFLKDEVQRLTFTVNEQKKVIQSQSEKLSSLEENNLPTDIVVLKDMVLNQREELIKKDKDIEILKKTLEDITLELEESKQFKEENEELIYAQKSIVQLTEENEILNQKIEELQEIIAEKTGEDHTDRDQQLIDAKKLLFQLTEENGIKSVKIESLKAENEDFKHQLEDTQERVKYLKEKLEKVSHSQQGLDMEKVNQLDQTITNLKEENSDLRNIIDINTNVIEKLKIQNVQLTNELEDKDTLEQNLTIQNEKEIEELTQKLIKIENANQQLNELLNELKEKELQIEISDKVPINSKPNLIRNVHPNLFRIMYDFLDDDSKLKVKDILIRDLNSNEREARTYAIKTLSLIQDKEILNELKAMKTDDDWIIKLYLIKALSLFDKEEVKDTLELLVKDKDPDVRDSADKVLSR